MDDNDLSPEEKKVYLKVAQELADLNMIRGTISDFAHYMCMMYVVVCPRCCLCEVRLLYSKKYYVNHYVFSLQFLFFQICSQFSLG